MAEPAPTPTPKKVPGKGKPMGIPMWGWIIAAVLGIVIGYTILKKSGGGMSGFPGAGEADGGLALPSDESSSGGGSVAAPLDLEAILKALGLRGSSTTTPSPTTQEPQQQQQESQQTEEVQSFGDDSSEASDATYDPYTDPIPDFILGTKPYVPIDYPYTGPNYAAGAMGLGVIAPTDTYGPSPNVNYGSIAEYFTTNPIPVFTAPPPPPQNVTASAPAPTPVTPPVTSAPPIGGSGSRVNVPT